MTHDPIKLLIDIPRVHGAHQGDKVAIAFEGRDLTYAEMDRRSDQAAGMLQQAGVKAGDRVAWLGRASEAWFEIFFGVAKARACFAPINTRLATPEVAFILKDSGADLFFVSPEFYVVAEAIIAEIDRPIRVIGVGGGHPMFGDYAALRRRRP